MTEHMEGPLDRRVRDRARRDARSAKRGGSAAKLAVRADTPEIASFVRSMIQADQLGISLGRILRCRPQDTRAQRQAAAEEQASKAPIKMLFPTVLFIFPSMFIVILGPALIGLKQVLGF